MNKGKVQLVRFSHDKHPVDQQVYEYNVEHNNGVTSVEQTMTLTCNPGMLVNSQKWLATIELDNFPLQASPKEAAEKLADWLERLSSAIRAGEYIDISKLQPDEFKDLNIEDQEGK